MTIPDVCAKAAPAECKINGTPVVSFPFYVYIDDPSSVRYLHWEFVDPDSIPVCGFEWIHWSVANLPVGALMFDFNDSRALHVPQDFSRQLPAMVPEALQGRTSAASKFVGGTDPAVTMRYNGPYPPDRDHEYYLHVWGTSKPLSGLSQGFYLNELERAIRDCGETPEQAGVFLTGRA